MKLRRLFSLFIDLFSTYAISRIILFVLALLDYRFSFENIFALSGIIYSVGLNYFFKRTLGYFLLNISVEYLGNKNSRLLNIIKRELLGKWIIAIILPIIILQFIAGVNWINTIYHFYILIILFLINLFYLLIFKKMWYDYFLKVEIARNLSPKKIKKNSFYSILVLMALIIFTFNFEYKSNGWISCKFSLYQSSKSTREYRDVIKNAQKTPKEYVLNLFEKKDIVVLSERLHPETTQWDFIYELVKDTNFINSVGLIYTEYGQIGIQSTLDSLMHNSNIDENEIEQKVLHIVRNDAVWPYSDLTGFYRFLKRLALLNQTLTEDKKIDYQFTDAEVDWYNLTKKGYEDYTNNKLRNRDEIMANSIISDFNSRKVGQKCLVIMNNYHAFNLVDMNPIPEWKSTYYFLKEEYNERVTNVLINKRIWGGFPPIANGSWDEAFRKEKNIQVGFDIKNTPFGYDIFDLVNFKRISSLPFSAQFYGDEYNAVNFSNVYDGFVFINPIKEQLIETGIPGYFDGFEEESLRRCKLIDDNERLYRIAKSEINYAQEFPKKRKSPELFIESTIEIVFFLLFSIGFFVAVFAFFFFKKR